MQENLPQQRLASPANLLPILVWPAATLTTPANLVRHFDGDLKRLVRTLFATMYHNNGIGLAANQVGTLQRVLVIDLDPDKERDEDLELDEQLKTWGYSGPIAAVNPCITAREGEVMFEEGCLSLPGVQIDVLRSASITMQAQDVGGATFTLRASGLFAVALQHEMDHLDGKVFVDYLEPDLREKVRQEMLRSLSPTQPGL